MTISVSGTFPSQPAYTSSSAPGSVAARQAQQPQPSDEVTLSQSAQVSQFSQQGQSPSQIAQTLGISVSLVILDLGIVATPAPAPAPKAAELAHTEAPKAPASPASA
jgi:hypothetical protein